MFAVIFALVLAITAPHAHAQSADVDAPTLPDYVYSAFETCAPVDVSEASGLPAATVEWLRESGWEGSNDDGLEALYAPNCLQVMALEGMAGDAGAVSSSFVTASDGTRTINVLEENGPTHGWVISLMGEAAVWTN
jgi:hypothetical protein